MLTSGRAESLLLLLSREPGAAPPALPILGRTHQECVAPANRASHSASHPEEDPGGEAGAQDLIGSGHRASARWPEALAGPGYAPSGAPRAQVPQGDAMRNPRQGRDSPYPAGTLTLAAASILLTTRCRAWRGYTAPAQETGRSKEGDQAMLNRRWRALTLLPIALALGACSALGLGQTERTIAVTGEGSVVIPPDTVVVTLGVQTRGTE